MAIAAPHGPRLSSTQSAASVTITRTSGTTAWYSSSATPLAPLSCEPQFSFYAPDWTNFKCAPSANAQSRAWGYLEVQSNATSVVVTSPQTTLTPRCAPVIGLEEGREIAYHGGCPASSWEMRTPAATTAVPLSDIQVGDTRMQFIGGDESTLQNCYTQCQGGYDGAVLSITQGTTGSYSYYTLGRSLETRCHRDFFCDPSIWTGNQPGSNGNRVTVTCPSGQWKDDSITGPSAIHYYLTCRQTGWVVTRNTVEEPATNVLYCAPRLLQSTLPANAQGFGTCPQSILPNHRGIDTCQLQCNEGFQTLPPLYPFSSAMVANASRLATCIQSPCTVLAPTTNSGALGTCLSSLAVGASCSLLCGSTPLSPPLTCLLGPRFASLPTCAVTSQTCTLTALFGGVTAPATIPAGTRILRLCNAAKGLVSATPTSMTQTCTAGTSTASLSPTTLPACVCAVPPLASRRAFTWTPSYTCAAESTPTIGTVCTFTPKYGFVMPAPNEQYQCTINGWRPNSDVTGSSYPVSLHGRAYCTYPLKPTQYTVQTTLGLPMGTQSEVRNLAQTWQTWYTEDIIEGIQVTCADGWMHRSTATAPSPALFTCEANLWRYGGPLGGVLNPIDWCASPKPCNLDGVDQLQATYVSTTNGITVTTKPFYRTNEGASFPVTCALEKWTFPNGAVVHSFSECAAPGSACARYIGQPQPCDASPLTAHIATRLYVLPTILEDQTLPLQCQDQASLQSATPTPLARCLNGQLTLTGDSNPCVWNPCSISDYGRLDWVTGCSATLPSEFTCTLGCNYNYRVSLPDPTVSCSQGRLVAPVPECLSTVACPPPASPPAPFLPEWDCPTYSPTTPCTCLPGTTSNPSNCTLRVNAAEGWACTQKPLYTCMEGELSPQPSTQVCTQGCVAQTVIPGSVALATPTPLGTSVAVSCLDGLVGGSGQFTCQGGRTWNNLNDLVCLLGATQSTLESTECDTGAGFFTIGKHSLGPVPAAALPLDISSTDVTLSCRCPTGFFSAGPPTYQLQLTATTASLILSTDVSTACVQRSCVPPAVAGRVDTLAFSTTSPKATSSGSILCQNRTQVDGLLYASRSFTCDLGTFTVASINVGSYTLPGCVQAAQCTAYTPNAAYQETLEEGTFLVVDTVVSTCAAGFSRSAGVSAQQSLTCGGDVLTPRFLCNPDPCIYPVIPNTQLALPESTPSGYLVAGICLAGHTLNTVYCKQGSFYDSLDEGATLTLPQCTPNACAVTPPTHGTMGTCDSSPLPSGSTCQPTCNAGYTLTGGPYSCTAGTRSGSPLCTPNACTIPAPLNGNLGTCSALLPHGQACTFACNPGFSAPSLAVGCNLGQPTPATLPTCTACATCTGNPCIDFTPPPHATNGTCQTVIAPHTCQWKCDEGYELSPPTNSLTCNSSGTLSGNLTCVPTACADRPDHCTGLVTGGNCSLACTNGRIRQGDEFITCPLGRAEGSHECVFPPCNLTSHLGLNMSAYLISTLSRGTTITPACFAGWRVTSLECPHATLELTGGCLPPVLPRSERPISNLDTPTVPVPAVPSLPRLEENTYICTYACPVGFYCDVSTATPRDRECGPRVCNTPNPPTCLPSPCRVYPAPRFASEDIIEADSGTSQLIACAPGYGPSVSYTCAATIWTKDETVVLESNMCPAQTCTKGLRPANAILPSPPLTTGFTTQQTFSCPNGYTPMNNHLQCPQGEFGYEDGATCHPNPCDNADLPLDIDFGTTDVVTGSTDSGDSAAITCDEGYTPTPHLCSQGVWTPGACLQPNQCQLTLDNALLPRYNGSSTCLAPVSNSAPCSLTCSAGYHVQGSSTTTLEQTLICFGAPFSYSECIPSPCTLEGLPSHINTGPLSHRVTGDTVSLVCNSGYTLSAPSNATCQARSNRTLVLSNPAVTCTPSTCSLPAASGTVQGYGSVGAGRCSAASLASGAQCTRQCATGFKPVVPNTPAISSCVQGVLITTGDPQCVPIHSCYVGPTFASPWVSNATLSTLQCAGGYVQSGSTTGTCSSEGVLSNRNVECVPAPCIGPPTTTHGNFTALTLTCHLGYILEGPTTATCINQAWNTGSCRLLATCTCNGNTIREPTSCPVTTCAHGPSSQVCLSTGQLAPLLCNPPPPPPILVNTSSSTGVFNETSDASPLQAPPLALFWTLIACLVGLWL